MTTNKPTLEDMSPRRRRNRERTIQAILDTSRVIMRENGVGALSMQELARRLDMQAPSLYNYFSGLMDIYDAVFRLGYTLWGEYFKEYIQDAQTWQDKVRLALEAYLTFALSNPELYQLCFERPVPGFVPSEESLQVSFGILHDVYERIGKLKKDIDTDLPTEQLADLLLAITHGITALHMANEPHLPLGQGRFGALFPAVLSLLERAWSKG
ncbi:MAG: TetR/AcrR family transcriptional regulator [Anaerolineales bacterium]|nr:TetR/AcrR family transcriptional regulator [Anaerolineales bacterium]